MLRRTRWTAVLPGAVVLATANATAHELPPGHDRWVRGRGARTDGKYPAVVAGTAGRRRVTVPGMPAAAPGMDLPGADSSPFDVLTFDRSGAAAVYARHEATARGEAPSVPAR